MIREKNTTKIDGDIKLLLSNHLGIESDELSNEDLLKEDLHMSASDISDFTHLLNKKGYLLEIKNISDIESIQNLIDLIIENEEF